MNYFSSPSKASLWSSSLINFHCLQQNPADSDHLCCVSVWRGTGSARVIGCRDSAKPLMLRTLLATHPWQCCPAQILLPCLAKCSLIHRPSVWWVKVMVLSDKCISAEGPAQKLVGEVSGVVQLVGQSKLTSTWLLLTRSWLWPAAVTCVKCKQSLCNAWICGQNPTVAVNMRTRRDILLIFWTYEDVFLEGREKRLR